MREYNNGCCFVKVKRQDNREILFIIGFKIKFYDPVDIHLTAVPAGMVYPINLLTPRKTSSGSIDVMHFESLHVLFLHGLHGTSFFITIALPLYGP